MDKNELIHEIDSSVLEAKQVMFDLMENGGSGHIGGSLSIIDALMCLFHTKLVDDANYLVYSKGHAEVAIYAALIERGLLKTGAGLKELGSPLQGHPSKKWISQFNYSSGSLGQGLSYAAGMAAALDSEQAKVFCVLGDGELQEGQVFEAVITASSLKLSNLIALIDCNGLQLEGRTIVTGGAEEMSCCWKNLGWDCAVIDGHDTAQLIEALNTPHQEKPFAIFLKTIKGHGVSFMEMNPNYHGVSLSKEELNMARRELCARI